MGRRDTHWIAESETGRHLEWESETTIFEPDHRIAWRSFRGAVDTDGEVVLEELALRKTLVHMVVGYDVRGHRELGLHIFGRQPVRQLEEDLRRLKRIAERGPGRRSEDDVSWSGREPGPSVDYASAREGRRELEQRGDSFGAPDRLSYGERVYNRGRALRDEAGPIGTRRSEGVPRYPEEHERNESFRREYEIDRGFASRSADRGYLERGDEPRRRYAMTPRERERDRAEQRELERRRWRETFNLRGVDRLLDDNEPGRWRRRD